MKKLIPLLLIVFSFTFCSKNNLENSNPIIGEWKLIKIEQTFRTNPNSFTDYSNQNVIFTFDSNSILKINNTNLAFNAGSYIYDYKNDYLSGFPSSGETKILLVVINDQKWTYELNNGIMKLSLSYVDGPNLYLEKKAM